MEEATLQPAASPPSAQEKDASATEETTVDCSPQNKAQVLIIGAGIAGLSVANQLLENGFDDFLILEAKHRVGGRIDSMLLGGQMVELGATWIHGILDNPIFRIALNKGMVSVVNIPKKFKVVGYTEDGNEVPRSLMTEVCDAYVCFVHRCEEYFDGEYSPPSDVNSVGEHINYEIELHLSSETDPKERKLKQQLFNCLLKRETCITGCNSMNDTDLLELGSYTELQGGNIGISTGFTSILKPFTELLPEGSIITNCPVKKIHWRSELDFDFNIIDEYSENESSEDSQRTVINNKDDEKEDEGVVGGVVKEEEEKEEVDKKEAEKKVEEEEVFLESAMENDYPIQVTCEDGRIFYAEHVVCAIPLGVLKETHETLFEPNLPRYKREAIENLMFGTVNKIYLEYENPFPYPPACEILLLWDDDKYQVEAPDDGAEEYLRENWYKKIYSFTVVSDTLLQAWVSGREAEYMETLSDEQICEKCTEILRVFLKDLDVPHPKRCVRTSWKSDPFFCGSYTSIPVGATQADIERLVQPLYAGSKEIKPAVLFAGEHTQSSFYSTVHGAFYSGCTAARFLLFYGNLKGPASEETELEETAFNSWEQGIPLD